MYECMNMKIMVTHLIGNPGEPYSISTLAILLEDSIIVINISAVPSDNVQGPKLQPVLTGGNQNYVVAT